MKKISYLLLMLLFPAFVMVGCSDDNNGGDKQIELPNQSEKTQTAFADDETTGGFTFTAQSSWTATVAEQTSSRASGVSWLRLLLDGSEKYSGDAGKYTLTIELDPNYTGQTRSATITIRSGDDEITITVTQDKAKQDGSVQKLISRIIYHDHDEDDGHGYDETHTFTYDSRGRVISYEEYSEWSAEDIVKYNFTYETGGITVKEIESPGTTKTWTYQLNNKGYVTSMTSLNRPNGYNYMDRVITLSYDNNDYLKKATTKDTEHEGAVSTYSSEYTWGNGNLMNVNSGEGHIDYYTYNDFPNIYNLDINQFIYDQFEPVLILGLAGKTSKNLVETRRWPYEDPDDLTTIRYEFDADQYVTKIYATWTHTPETLWIEIKYLD